MFNSTMNTSTNAKRTSNVVADCYNNMPIAKTISPCTSEESSASSTTASTVVRSITGKYSDIEDRYKVDPRVLGTGHYGSVRECVDRITGQRYAVKSIRKSDPGLKPAGLDREITLLQEMRHRNIIKLVDIHEDEEYVHLVTDLCKGGELFDKIVDKSSADNGATCFTEAEAARILHQILTAVSYMHKHDVAHRDIKPENVLFETTDEDSKIKIIDFGLAREHFGGIEPHMSTTVGTPYYIAPEVLRKKYTKSCDLWSVGVIAYILLCGYPPFNGSNNDETHRAVLRGRYYFSSEDWKDVSGEAKDFVRKLLRLDVRKRMTVEEALNHPWILKHTVTDVAASDEAAVKRLRWSLPTARITRHRRCRTATMF